MLIVQLVCFRREVRQRHAYDPESSSPSIPSSHGTLLGNRSVLVSYRRTSAPSARALHSNVTMPFQHRTVPSSVRHLADEVVLSVRRFDPSPRRFGSLGESVPLSQIVSRSHCPSHGSSGTYARRDADTYFVVVAPLITAQDVLASDHADGFLASSSQLRRPVVLS